MIFWGTIVIFVMVTVSMVICIKKGRYADIIDMTIRLFVSTVTGMAAIIMAIIILLENTSAPVKIEKIQNQRIAIESKLESGFYADNFGILDKNIINDIYEYNNTVIDKTRYIDNFWVGPFYPKAYEVLETIDYDIANDYARLVEEKEPVQPETATSSEVENNET